MALVLGGCGSSGTALIPARQAPQADQPWLLPVDALETQRLYRVKYQGPEGKLNFKLTLYLESAERYRLLAADPVGRKLWELFLEPTNEAILVDHRQKLYCHADQADQMTLVPIARLPMIAIPKLLLGFLPASPDRRAQWVEDRVIYRDRNGELWQAGWEDGALAWWSVGEQGDPTAFWRRQNEDGKAAGIFSDRRGQQQIRWREMVAERMTRPLSRPDIPANYELGSCNPSPS